MATNDEIQANLTRHFDERLDHLREVMTLQHGALTRRVEDSHATTAAAMGKLAGHVDDLYGKSKACELKSADLEHRIEGVKKASAPLMVLINAVSVTVGAFGLWLWKRVEK